MKVSHRSARILGALAGVVLFVIAMNAYILAPIHHSFETSWVPYVLAWVTYRLAWARLSMLRRCPGGCGARIFYQLETCPHCLTPLRARTETPALAEAVPRKLARTGRG